MQGILRLLVLPGCGGACSYGVTVTRPEADTRALGFRALLPARRGRGHDSRVSASESG